MITSLFKNGRNGYFLNKQKMCCENLYVPEKRGVNLNLLDIIFFKLVLLDIIFLLRVISQINNIGIAVDLIGYSRY